MRKIVLILSIFVSISFCKPLGNGLYISKECPSTIIQVSNSLTLYNVDSRKYSSYLYNKKGKYYTLQKAREFYPLSNSGLQINNFREFKIFDYDKLTSCKDESSYIKVDSIKALSDFLEKSKKFNFPYQLWNNIKDEFFIDKNNVVTYNNLGYHFYKNGYYQQADFFLRLVLERFPNRTVAYLNYADNLDKLMDQKTNVYHVTKDGVTKYYLTYISQMMFKNKERLIPQKIKTNYQKYFSMLKQLNSTIKEPYAILDFTEGDLNKDSFKDISFVIEFANSKNIENSRKYSIRFSNRNSRVWLVFFKEKEKYRLVSKNGRFLQPDTNSNCDDPFAGLSIKNQSLFLNLYYWCSMGSWGQGGAKYQILYRDKKLILAGIEKWDDSRADGRGSKTSINFLTKKKIYYKTVDHGDEVGVAKTSKVKAKTPILFKDIK